jgi:hypothetical protein
MKASFFRIFIFFKKINWNSRFSVSWQNWLFFLSIFKSMVVTSIRYNIIKKSKSNQVSNSTAKIVEADRRQWLMAVGGPAVGERCRAGLRRSRREAPPSSGGGRRRRCPSSERRQSRRDTPPLTDRDRDDKLLLRAVVTSGRAGGGWWRVGGSGGG